MFVVLYANGGIQTEFIAQRSRGTWILGGGIIVEIVRGKDHARKGAIGEEFPKTEDARSDHGDDPEQEPKPPARKWLACNGGGILEIIIVNSRAPKQHPKKK